MNKSFLGFIGALVIGFFIIVFLLIGYDRVEPGYAAVIQNKANGQIRVVSQVGWTWVSPFTESSTTYPISTEMLILTKASTEGSDGDDSLDVPTKEGQNVNIDASMSFRVTDVEKLYRKYRGADIDTITHKVIRNALNNELMAITAKYSILDINENRDEITARTLERIKNSLASEGIDAEKFNLRAVRLPNSIQSSFAAKVTAENQIKQAEALEKQAEIRNRILINNAKAIATSNKIQQTSLTPAMLEKMRIEKLNPRVEVIYVPTNTNMFLGK